MHNAEALETTEVPDIDGQQLSNAMNIHARCQASVMDLHTLNVMGDKQGSPSVMYFPAIRQQFEIPLDHTRKPIRFDDAQAESIFV
jgi:hypothetical protein